MNKIVRTKEERQRLYDITEGAASLGTIWLAGFIDFTLALVPALIITLTQSTLSEFSELIFFASWIAFAFLLLCVKFSLKGTSVGMLILGIRYAYLYNGHQISRDDYVSLFFKNIEVDMIYNNWYENMEFLSSDLLQNIAMKKMGIVRLRTSKCRECEEKYLAITPADVIKQLQETNPDSSILNVEHDTIFKD